MKQFSSTDSIDYLHCNDRQETPSWMVQQYHSKYWYNNINYNDTPISVHNQWNTRKGKKYDEEKLGREKERIHLFLKFRSEEKNEGAFSMYTENGAYQFHNRQEIKRIKNVLVDQIRNSC
jgi:hypothetical protein